MDAFLELLIDGARADNRWPEVVVCIFKIPPECEAEDVIWAPPLTLLFKDCIDF